MKIVIKKADESEIGLITSIIRDSFEDVARRFGITIENAPTHPSNCTVEWVEAGMKKGIAYYIMEGDGVPIGSAAIEGARPGLFYLERLAILPEYRGKGYGSLLSDYACDEAKVRGAKNVEIGIIEEDKRLQTWYEKIGFRVMSRCRFDHLPFGVTFMSREV